MGQAEQTTAPVFASSFHQESCNSPELLQRSFCFVLSPRQETALWGTAGIHKYSGPEKFVEYVVKDLWQTAEVVMVEGVGWGEFGVVYEPCCRRT